MRVRLVVSVAAVATVALAVFAATGFGGEGSAFRVSGFDYSPERVDVERVDQPSGPVSSAALGEASKKKGKVKFLFFETPEPVDVPAGGIAAFELICPKGKAVTGTFLPPPDNTLTFLSASALGTSLRNWLVRVTNVSATSTQAALGVVCATGVK